MSSVPEASNDNALLKQALVALRQARQRLDAIEQSRKEPIAIIGMACRFPGGANSPEAFWNLLANGEDGISPIPVDRWDADELYDADPDAPSKMNSRWGGFISEVDQFDPYFFSISPREAAQMDPQQRLLLEVAWEAIEHAGLTRSKLAGSQTGVYVGIHSQSNDYGLLQYADAEKMDIYTGTGSAHNVLPGRLAYWLDLRGPSVTVDTACSSSLVTVHLACQSLRLGESQQALVAGVNLILSPLFTISASKMHMLAPDGRCKSFDAAADGFVRGEGCGVVVLKRLSDAIADGDPILAVICGSAINQDGHSNGLTAPNGLSQQRVIKQALENAGVAASKIGYVETHGTGTILGDPIEVEALANVFTAADENRQTCYLGAVKTNIGHLEGAAGIAGLIKTVLVLQHKCIPPIVHFKQLNPHISIQNTPFKIPTKLTAWDTEGSRVAGISAFGWSGTNAHLIVAEAPKTQRSINSENTSLPRSYVVPFSAQSGESLKRLAQSFQEFLAGHPNIEDVGYTASVRRTHHEHRLAVTGRSTQEISETLSAYLQGQSQSNISVRQHNPDMKPKVAFVFPGQGSQWFGMARELMSQEPVFLDALTSCEEAFRQYVDWSVLEQLNSDETSSRLNEIDVIQPTLFAIQIALASLWRSWGIEPEAVIGHSMGEIAAAHIAGAIRLKEAAQIICRRSQLLRKVSGQGAMAVIGLPMDRAEQSISGYEDKVSIAVSNSPRSTVLSGDPLAMDAILEKLRAQNVFCRLVKVDVASHSPQMDPLRGDLLNLLVGIEPQAGNLPIYSTVTGEVCDGATFQAGYWANNLRQPVSFSKMIQKLARDGFTVFLELSPHPILLSAIEETLQSSGQIGFPIASFERDQPERQAMLNSLGKLYTLGCPIHWTGLYSSPHSPISLPAYPWHHQRYWLDTGNLKNGSAKLLHKYESSNEEHPVLGRRLADLAHLPGSYFWEKKINAQSVEHLRHDSKEETAVLTEKLFQKLALAATENIFGNKTHAIKEVVVNQPLLFSVSEHMILQFILKNEDASLCSFEVYGKTGNAGTFWDLYGSGKVSIGLASKEWFYELDWQVSDNRSTARQPRQDGYWLLFTDNRGVGDALKSTGRCITVRPGDAFQNPEYDSFTINPSQPDDFRRLLNQTLNSLKMPCHGILFLWAVDSASEDIAAEGCRNVLNLLQALFHFQYTSLPKLWLITQGAQSALADSTSTNIAQASLWGMGRVICREHPELWGGLIDLDPNASPLQNAARLLDEVSHPNAENQLCLRGEQRYVARLVETKVDLAEQQPLTIRSDATYLITGGLGGLGLKIAGWLIQHGARYIALMGRRGITNNALQTRISELEQSGAQILVLKGDVSQKEPVRSVLSKIEQTMPALKGIFHAAGVLDDGILLQQDWERFRRVLAPKIAGTWNLHVLTQQLPLDLFVLFSSASSLLGMPGQGNYAAANAFLDAFAHYRRQQSLPCTSINWGMWTDVGLAMEEQRNNFLKQSGFLGIAPDEGLSALEYLLQCREVSVAVLPIDWITYIQQAQNKGVPVLLSKLSPERNNTQESITISQSSAFLETLYAAPAQEIPELLATCITNLVKLVMHFNDDFVIDPQRGFFQLGMDSLMAVQLRNHLQRVFDRTLPPTLTFDYPTVSMLVDYFLDVFNLSISASSEENVSTDAEMDRLEEEIAQLSRAELKGLLDDEFEATEKGL